MTLPRAPRATAVVALEFDEYVNLHDVGELFVLMGRIYDTVLYAFTPDLRDSPRADAARLRLQTVQEGSILVRLATGITQLTRSRDPVAEQRTEGPGTLRSVLGLVKEQADWALEQRRQRQELDRAARQSQIDLARQQLALRTQAEHAELDLAERRLELQTRSAQAALDLEEGRRDLNAATVQRNLDLLAKVKSSLAHHAEAVHYAVDQAMLAEVSAVVTADLDELQRVFVRSRFTSFTVEQDGNPIEPPPGGPQPIEGNGDASDSTTR